jgi:hypothetical protein
MQGAKGCHQALDLVSEAVRSVFNAQQPISEILDLLSSSHEEADLQNNAYRNWAEHSHCIVDPFHVV